MQTDLAFLELTGRASSGQASPGVASLPGGDGRHHLRGGRLPGRSSADSRPIRDYSGSLTRVRQGGIQQQPRRRAEPDSSDPAAAALCPARAIRCGSGSGDVAARRLGARGTGIPEGPSLVSDAQCGARLAALAAGFQRTVDSVESVTISRGVLESLIARSTPLGYARSGRATWLVAVREYLRAHLDEPVQTAALAAISGLTECHLIRSFHLEFGLPPHAYHLRLRLAVAAELLSNGLSVSTVAYECGFADQSHLSRKFKEVYGLTPAAWASGVLRTVQDWGLDCRHGGLDRVELACTGIRDLVRLGSAGPIQVRPTTRIPGCRDLGVDA